MGVIFNTIKEYLEKNKDGQVILEGVDGAGKSTLISPLIYMYPYFKSYGFTINDGPKLYNFRLLSKFKIIDRLAPISAYTYSRVRYNKPINLEYTMKNIREFFKEYLSENALLVLMLDNTRYPAKDKGFEGVDYSKLEQAYEELIPGLDFCDVLVSRKNNFEFRRRKG